MDNHEHESEELGLPLEHVITETGDRELAFLWLAIAAGAGAGIVVLALLADGSNSPSASAAGVPSWAYVVLGLVLLATLVAAYFRIRVWASWSNPQLFLPSSEPLHLGDQVVVRVRRTARGASDLSGLIVTATLRASEKVVYRARGRSHLHRVEVYEAPVAVALEVIGRTVEADLNVDIPVFEAPPTMDLGNNEVRWELSMRMAAPNAPDDDTTFPLVIAPAVATRLQEGSGR